VNCAIELFPQQRKLDFQSSSNQISAAEAQGLSVLILRRNWHMRPRPAQSVLELMHRFVAGISSSPGREHYARRDPWWKFLYAIKVYTRREL
jgi:hypothetical protein